MPGIEKILETRAICETEYEYVLFHGTNTNFSKVNLAKSKEYTDFGKGFYLTNIFEQAVDWAGNLRRIEVISNRVYSGDIIIKKNFPEAYVLKFELLPEKLKDKKMIIFEDYCEEWLDTIVTCRRPEAVNNKKIKKRDITIGPMADSGLNKNLDDYIYGAISKEEVLEKIKIKKPNMQIAFHTEKSLEAIKLISFSTVVF